MAWAVWITGLPGCGKTVVAQRVKDILKERGIAVRVLELDEIRKVITPEPTYSEEEREIVYAALAYMAMLLTDVGTNAIIDATGNRRRYRDLARSLIPDFAEAYIKCPLNICIQRERGRESKFSPGNVYEKAASADATVPGVNVPYEEPKSPEIVVDSDCLSVDGCAEEIVKGISELTRSYSAKEPADC